MPLVVVLFFLAGLSLAFAYAACTVVNKLARALPIEDNAAVTLLAARCHRDHTADAVVRAITDTAVPEDHTASKLAVRLSRLVPKLPVRLSFCKAFAVVVVAVVFCFCSVSSCLSVSLFLTPLRLL